MQHPKKARSEQNTARLESDAENNLARLNEPEITPADRNGFNRYFQKAAFKRDAETAAQDDSDTALESLTTRQKVVLKPKESREIEIPVRDGKHAGVLIVASYAVAATLFDETGAQIGKNIVDSPIAARQLFRVINADRQIKNAVWKLKLENYDANEQIVYVAGWTSNGASSAFTVEAGKANAAGNVLLQAKLSENNAPVLNAKITGKIVGRKKEIEFFDDGKHGDGASGDGVYGANIEKLAKGEYFVEAKAEANNQTKFAVAPVTIGASSAVVKLAARRGQ